MTFIPGIQLCESFYFEAIRPILDTHFPGIPHTAALIGSGSEILGFDDAMSSDHHWGPRGMLFLRPEDFGQADSVRKTLSKHLPYQFKGFSTHFSEPDPNDSGVQLPVFIDSGLVNHRVEIWTLPGYFSDYLGWDFARPLCPTDWLVFPQQKLRTLTGGAVYHDDLGLAEIRAKLAWYPHDLWLYLLAAGWARIGQEEAFVGRTGMVGDDLGSAIITARLARDVMRLCFLMEKTYAPYSKWFGTAFKRLACAPEMMETLQNAISERTWQERESFLVPAYKKLARMHNALKITESMPETVRDFFGRPFRVIELHGFSSAICKQITDPEIKVIAENTIIGSIDLFSDNTDFLDNLNNREKIKNIYS